jgi:hypothetical protein
MATEYGNKGIVTSGLTFCLDAGNLKSYPTTGTTWTDLSRNNLNGTLSNCTFNSSNLGGIVFNGTNSVTNLSSINFGSGEFTVNYWLTKNSRLYRYVHDLGGLNTGSIAFGPGTGAALTASAALNVYGGSKILAIGTELGTSWYPINTPFELSVTRSGSVSKLYLNGSLIYTDTATGTYGGASTSKIGDYGGGGFPFDGIIYNVKFYNRALSASEVLQNYNATKWRFQ